MNTEKKPVNVIALVDNLELEVPWRISAAAATEDEEQRKIKIFEDEEGTTGRRFNLGDLGLGSRIAILNDKTPETKKPEKPTDSQQPPKSPKNDDKSIPKKQSRNRHKKTLEIRRNPTRTVVAVRKESAESKRPASSRQRLLAARRRCVPINDTTDDETTTTTNKRHRTANHNGYMSTRSVTRKQGSVGAIYEAPSWRDEVEWKEWPAHGMHERPVYHSQIGLGAEYNGKVYASYDNESYREIGNSDEAQHQIKNVKLEQRVESLTDGTTISVIGKSNGNTEIGRYAQQQRQQISAITAARQKFAGIGIGRPRLPINVAGYGNRLHNLSQSLGLMQQQQQHQQRQIEQMRNIERLQKIESLQRARMQQQQRMANEKYTMSTTTNRLLSNDVLRTLQQSALHRQINGNGLGGPSKCYFVPRDVTATTAGSGGLSFCEVQAVKANSKGKLFFVKAPETPKRLGTERTSTITSATQSASVSWAEVSLTKRPDGTSALLVDVPRTYATNDSNHLTSNEKIVPNHRHSGGKPALSMGYPPVRLAESSGMFRPKSTLTEIETNNVGALDYRRAIADDENVDDDQQSVVLDLSKKDGARDKDASEEIKVTQSYKTDLVHYFQNFGADDNIDMMENSKNLT